MLLLKKIIQLREKSHSDHEKPFLEHLEDLRVVVTRVVITLVIAMLLCFMFNKKLMEFFRYPVDRVLVTQLEVTLPGDAPRPFTVESWGAARKVEHAVVNLSPVQRQNFFQQLGDETLAFQAQSISLLRAALALPEGKREAFMMALAESDELKLQLKTLLKTHPNIDADPQGHLKMMSALKPTEGFMLSMKLSFVAGIVVSFPLLLFFILQFVLPGLHSHEKRVLWPAMAVGFGLFLVGTAFAYWLVLPRTLLFFAEWSSDMGISNDWRIGEYISFATQFTLLFGLSFELPVVIMVLVKLGLLSYETMARTRSYAIVAIFIAAAVLTPTPDALTLCLMALPMIILYEICIWLAYFDHKKSLGQDEREAKERMENLLKLEETVETPEVSDELSRAESWHQQDTPQTSVDEAGDDGWQEVHQPIDPDRGDELPQIDEASPDSGPKKKEDSSDGI